MHPLGWITCIDGCIKIRNFTPSTNTPLAGVDCATIMCHILVLEYAPTNHIFNTGYRPESEPHFKFKQVANRKPAEALEYNC